MNCEAAREMLEKVLDGEASDAEKTDVSSHLEHCPSCREHDAFLRTVGRTIQSSPASEPPEAYWDQFPAKVMARLERDEPSRQHDRPGLFDQLFRPAMLRFASAAVALILMVSLGVVVLRDERASEELHLEAPPPQLAPAEPAIRAQERDPAPDPRPVAPEPDVSARAEAALPAPPTPTPTPPRPSPLPGGAEASIDIAPPVVARDEPARLQVEASAAKSSPAQAEARELSQPSSAAMVAEDRAVSRPPQANVLLEEAPASVPPEEAAGADPAARRARALTDGLDCEAARSWLESNGDSGERGRDTRYTVARCSLEEHARRPDEQTEERALTDADAFLALETRDERAREIRELSAPLRR